MRPFLLAFLLCSLFLCCTAAEPALCAPSAAPETASSGASSQGKTPPGISLREDSGAPPALQQWKDWVLYDHKDRNCPRPFNNGKQPLCDFPSKITLRIGDKQAEFTQQWQVFGESAVPLPYATRSWPVEVTANGVAAPVADKNGLPVVFLQPGSYTLSGKLLWSAPPESLRLPAATALIELSQDGAPVPFPRIETNGSLLLTARKQEKQAEDTQQVRLFRLINDSVPMEITTLVRLQVSGRARRIDLPDVLFPHAVPLQVQSPLPLSFEARNGVSVQAVPGRWDINVTTRFPGPVEDLGPSKGSYGTEFWAFQAQSELRVVQLEGAPGVDPSTTELPDQWKGYPAYLIEPQATLHFKPMHRGAPQDIPDDWRLSREFWLDFDGQGLTVKDSFSGTLRKRSRLAMRKPGEPGRMTINNKDQSIVLLGKDQLPGVILTEQNLKLSAESRYEDFSTTLPSVGWDQDVNQLSASLNLPPGWTLLAAKGVDTASDTWLSKWNLLDIFLALIFSLAILRLKNPLTGLLALLFFAISFHEYGAPRYSWIFLLAALALVRIFATSEMLASWRFTRNCVLTLFGLAVVCMAFVSLQFAFKEIRSGLYPQYDYTGIPYAARQDAQMGKGANAVPKPKRAKAGARPAAEPMLLESQTDSLAVEEPYSMQSAPVPRMLAKSVLPVQESKQMLYDPEALVQTGPGLPDWGWRRIRLQWNGPVAQDEELQLWLLSPFWSMLLHFARALLLLAVFVPLADARRWLARFKEKNFSFSVALLLGVFPALGLALALSASPALAATGQNPEFPPQQLLDSYARRLTEPAACFPDCAADARLTIRLEQERLSLSNEMHLAAQAVVPLPLVSERWRPQSVRVDADPAVLRSEKGVLYALVPAGVHTVRLEGPVPESDSFNISFAQLRPKLAAVTAPGWEVQGIGPDGDLQGALRLARLQSPNAKDADRDASHGYTIPPFLAVERELVLGLTWEATTRVRRLSPRGQPIVQSIPLLRGESVLNEGVKVSNNQVQINLASDADSVSWRSRLDIAPELSLEAPAQVPWVEQWSVTAARIWDLRIAGIPPVSEYRNGQWTPTWRPWPGESVGLAVTRPETAPGASMTISSVDYALKAGSRLDENTLTLQIRASKGGRHRISIPQDAAVTRLESNGRTLPRIGMESGEIEFPYNPGKQSVIVAWRSKKAGASQIQAPEMDLQQRAVNVRMRYEIPKDRWILLVLGNPLMGSQVRFWSYCIAVLIGAWLLGLVPGSPLKRRQWFLLGLGLTQVGPWTILWAVLWLFALEWKRLHYPRQGWFGFDLVQLALTLLVAVGLANLYYAVHQGLLGQPPMQYADTAGYAAQHTLQWTQDRIAGLLPQPEVLSAPLWVYRVLMLLWSLWLAISLLRWWRWGWDCLSEGGLLRGPERRTRKKRVRPAAQDPEMQQPAVKEE